MEKKSLGTTVLLNLLIGGAGHVYASGGERWGFLVANLVCAVLAPFTGITALGCVLVWITSLLTSGTVVVEHNDRLKAKEEAVLEQRALKAAEEKKAAEEATAEENRLAKAARDKVSGAELALKVGRLSSLKASGMLTEEEYSQQTGQLLSEAYEGWTDEDLPTFLGPFAVHKESGSITDAQVQELKKLHSLLPRSASKSLRATEETLQDD
jgi:hypothetical protein